MFVRVRKIRCECGGSEQIALIQHEFECLYSSLPDWSVSHTKPDYQKGMQFRSLPPLPNSQCFDGFPAFSIPKVLIATTWAEKYRF